MCSSPRIKLTLVGGGVLENEIEDLAKLDSRITILPYASYEDIPSILKKHDVLIFPSRHDGYALTLIESMRAGLFIMGTAFTSSFNDHIIDKHNGLTIEVDAFDIKAKIDWCLGHVNSIKNLGIKNQFIIEQSICNSSISAKLLTKILQD